MKKNTTPGFGRVSSQERDAARQARRDAGLRTSVPHRMRSPDEGMRVKPEEDETYLGYGFSYSHGALVGSRGV